MHAFWHVFGWHAGENRDAILARKRKEIAANGWTLWSFRHRPNLTPWLDVIAESGGADPIVICSDSPGAKDPESTPARSVMYSEPNSGLWLPLPRTIESPHNYGRMEFGTAFKVAEIIDVPSDWGGDVEWLSVTSGDWRSGRIPTRGEYLLWQGAGIPTRPTYCALRLSAPFLVTVTKNPTLC